jgi:hypothetical protein
VGFALVVSGWSCEAAVSFDEYRDPERRQLDANVDHSEPAPDATTEDAATDVVATDDVANQDAALSCTPVDASSDASPFFPSDWHPPVAGGVAVDGGTTAAACTPTQVDALMSCNLDDTADQTTCDLVLKDFANRSCENCLFTSITAAQYGALIIRGNEASLNVAGCIARLANDITPTGCGATYQAAEECVDAACPLLPPPDPLDAGDAGDAGDAQAVEDCRKAARSLSGSCCPYVLPAMCADSLLDGGLAAVCVDEDDFILQAAAIGKVLCGP